MSKERILWAEKNGGQDRHFLPLSIDNYEWKTKKFDIYLIKIYFNHFNNGRLFGRTSLLSAVHLKFVTEFLAESCSFL